ncbi:GAF domain-containing sensor histidine kinase [Actinomycetospora termitidis]|uniref:histidine kinase n=1 Tax=Actinomycetospora termitidis TaxID=3053470 RepID=A0ABT7MC71_9PSEU|nr:ATP-binding protein [Actinomycetospora sp. Odt1-22]MDL5158269.1 hypothetical protein [Actinomycetospora sp. Odt1-22]
MRSLVATRALAGAILAVVVIGVYVAALAIAALVGGEAATRLPVLVAGTVGVALIVPRLRGWAGRLAAEVVLGRRAAPHEVLGALPPAPGAALPLDRVAERLAAGTGAAGVTVWAGDGDTLRPVACWPVPPATVAGEPAEGVSRRVPVVHDGEVLGALSITKSRARGIGPADERLLRAVAGGLGLALRTNLLTADLARQVRALEASRRRLAESGDQVRRLLGRDVRVRAAEPLTAVRERLDDLGRRAALRGAPRTAALVARTAADTATALAALGDFARGVHPPVLDADGLAPALRDAAAVAPVPVVIHGPAPGRRDPAQESALYFGVLEALQNVTKHAGAARVDVRLLERADALEVVVADDGRGLAPGAHHRGTGLAGIEDRLAAVGGGLRVESGPGGGTVLTMRVPSPAACPQPPAPDDSARKSSAARTR